MITRFTTYIKESKEFEKSLDHLETLNPDQLGKLLLDAVAEDFPDIKYIMNILDVGCPIDARDKDGMTALHYAAINGNQGLVELLISEGIDINAKTNIGITPLHLAVIHGTSNIQDIGYIEIIELLLSAGADINARDQYDQTPLHWAGKYGLSSMMKFLMDMGAEDNGKDVWGKSADNLFDDWMDENGILESRKSIEDLEMLNPDELGELLRYEVRSDPYDVQFIQDLLDVGCPIDARANNGRTALHWAAMYGGEVIKLLLSKGADIHAKDDWGRTALHIAALYGELKIIEFLVSNGADINVRDNEGWTPLYLATMDEKIGAIKFLVSKGADIHARTNGGDIAWDMATSSIKRRVPELNPNK